MFVPHTGAAPEARQKEDGMKGILFTTNGKVYRTTTPEAKRILKAVIKGEDAAPKTEDELAPVIALDGLTKESAWEEFKKIEVGE